jgi:hypothetical protein
MSAYYIINQNGLLKQYFSRENSTIEVDQIEKVIYTVSMRNAKVFVSYEDAESMITLYKLENCYVINQYGNRQEV